MKPCPCTPENYYSNCCEPAHSGTPVVTAEALMRSRYSAYVLGLETYLLDSWHQSTRPGQIKLFQYQWLGLRIIDTVDGQAEDNTGIIEFIARYKVNGKATRLQERSHFIKENGHWYYTRGEIQSD